MLWIVPFLWMMNVGCKEGNEKATDTIPIARQATLAATGSRIPDGEKSVYLERIKGFIDTMFGNGSLNGCVLVAKDGEVIYEQYMGYANPHLKRDSITANTPFHLASTSKTFTAMAILKLWQDGKLNIDAPVSTYLTGFPYPDVTVKLLLNHRSGLPGYDHFMEEMGWNKHVVLNNQDVLNFIISHANTLHVNRPDRSFSYSNTNFALLALIIEKVSGLSYHDYMKQTFFDPLGMNHTFVYTAADSASSLQSYFGNGRPYQFTFLDMVYGDKNIYSTARDLVKWDQALHTDSIFKPATLQAAYQGYSHEKAGTKNYGLGWRMYDLKNGKKIIYHNGWWHGNRAAFYRLTDENVVLIGLTNNDRPQIYAIKGMADIFGNYMQGGVNEDDADNEVVIHRKPTPRKIVKHSRSSSHSRQAVAHKKRSSRSSSAKK